MGHLNNYKTPHVSCLLKMYSLLKMVFFFHCYVSLLEGTSFTPNRFPNHRGTCCWSTGLALFREVGTCKSETQRDQETTSFAVKTYKWWMIYMHIWYAIFYMFEYNTYNTNIYIYISCMYMYVHVCVYMWISAFTWYASLICIYIPIWFPIFIHIFIPTCWIFSCTYIFR